MIYIEGDLVEVKLLPGLIWQVFEKTQTDTVTLNLWHGPAGWEIPPEQKLLFEDVKAGELLGQNELGPPNEMMVLAVTAKKADG